MSNLLKEQITNKKILQILLVVGLLCFAIEYGQSELGEEQDSVAVSANYQGHDGAICREVPEGYEVVLYNNENEEVFSMVYPCEPWIVNITEEVWEIGVSTGNPSRYVFYFDRQNSKISKTFFNPILFDNMYVAYMEGNKLILEDIFSEGILCEKITRDYSKMADPISAVDSIEILENGEILLQYYKGDDMELVSEIIEESSYLTVDWTDFEILMGHTIEPEDSGRGWEFSIADVDFDGTLELLVTFAANHCGQNALYIYKQENGRVFSFADTNAVFGKYVMSDIDYKAISPYMDIDLLAAYKNQNNEYRYLSLDYSFFGGNERGNIGTVTLYETILDKQTAPVKLAEISYVLPEETVEMYFRGERIYEAGELKDQLDEYMEGYTELEIKYETATKSFSRDIVSQSDEYKAKELVELYKSLEELLAEREELEEAEKDIKGNAT